MSVESHTAATFWLRPDGPMSYEQYADLVIGLWERGLDDSPASLREALPVQHRLAIESRQESV